MKSYRAYRLNVSGRIVSGDWIEAASDDEATSKAHAFCNHETPTVELWEGARLVARLPCEDEAAA